MSDKPDKEGQKRRKSRSNNDNERSKKKKVRPVTGVAMSKQLSEKINRTRSAPTSTRTSRSSTLKSKVPRLCGNGRPMPSLQDLERMFEDSDDGEPTAPPSTAVTQPVGCTTPEPEPITEEKLMSPTTIKKIADKLLENIEMYPTITLDHSPPPAIVPPKKRKKGDIPYIVGCKERKQVPWKPNTSFCKGDPKYGVDENGKTSDDDSPKKRQKRSKRVNISKSIFNSKTDEIVAMLEDSDTVEAPGSGSPDSNKTVEYDLNSNSPLQVPRSFSPLPSTSRDVDTITKNDQRFNESILSESLCKDESQNDIEVIETPCETILIDETTPNRNIFDSRAICDDNDDDCYVIIPSEDIKKRSSTSPIKIDSPKDDIYPSLDLTNFDTEITEVIDVEDVIAENKAIIDKYKQRTFDTVILVEPNISYAAKKSTQHTEDSSSNNVTDIRNNNSKEQPRQPNNIQNNVSENTIKDTPPLPIIGVESMEVNNENNYSSHIPNSNANIMSNIVTDFFNMPETCNCDVQSHIDQENLQDMLGGLRSMLLSINALQRRNAPRPGNYSNSTHTTDLITLQNTSGSQFSSNNTSVLPRHRHRRGNNNIPSRRGRNSTRDVGQHGLGGNFVVTNVSYVPANRNNRSHSNNIVPTPNYKRPAINNAPSIIPSAFQDRSTLEQEARLDQNTELLSRDCPICMESLSKSAVASTLCGHIFCMKCIKEAIRSSGKKCPTCRKTLKGIGYHQLFL